MSALSISLLSLSVCVLFSTVLFSSAYQPLVGNKIKCHNEGQIVKVPFLSDDPCISCKCVNKEIVCQREVCNSIKEDSVCRLSHNQTQYQTFDGKQYQFSGKCNYILSRDCKARTFSVHIVNKYGHNDSAAADNRNASHLVGTSVMVKIDDFKVRLGQAGRVSVGRTRVLLPHIRLGILSIVKDSTKVILRANIGLRVIWDSGNSIEIIVPPQFKYRTCGLCGNYNNNPNDDFLTKKGNIYTDVEKFAHSWKVGRNQNCENAMQTTKALNGQMRCSFKDWEQRYNAINVCNILKSPLFRRCHTSVSITPFFSKCLVDVCSCHKTKICHCNAIQTYANQCRRLGFYSQHWKRKTLCEAMRCPTGSKFSTCTSACKRTCHQPKHNCAKQKCRPGCECPIGQVWQHNKCIYKQLCPKPTNSSHDQSSLESSEPIDHNFLKDEALLNN